MQRNNEYIYRYIVIFFMSFFLLYIIVITSGCAAKHPNPLPEGPGTFDIPVAIEKFEKEVTRPVEREGVKESTDLIVTVPPSDKPTTLKFNKRKLPVLKNFLFNEPEHTVLSDNPAVTAEQPKKSGLLKHWALFAFAVLLIVTGLVGWTWQRIKTFSPWEVIKKILRL